MTLEEIQIAAYDFQRIPDSSLPAHDCLLWYMLRDIYDRYRNHVITHEEGEAEKKQAIRKYHENKSDYDTAAQILRNHAEMWKNIESTADAYRLHPSIENADAFLAAVYGVGRLKEGDRD